MDDKYIVSYLIFNKDEYLYHDIRREFDTLTEAITHVNEIVNNDKYECDYIFIKWGDSTIFKLGSD